MLSSIANSPGFGSAIDTARSVAEVGAASRAPKVPQFGALTRADQAKASILAQARTDLYSLPRSKPFIPALRRPHAVRAQSDLEQQTKLWKRSDS